MPPKTAADFQPEVLKLFDAYVHGLISRRDFLKGAARYTAIGLSAEALLEALQPRFAEAREVQGNDPRIRSSYIEHPSPAGHGRLRAYLVQPAELTGKLPTVLVVHENRGLNPHIEDIARRLAVDGYIALAPDALYPEGGYPGDEDEARALFPMLDQGKTRQDFIAAVGYLEKLPQGNGRIGVVGFCYGGGIAHFLSTRLPGLAAVVPFYGPLPAPEEAARVRAPLLIHFAETDERINADWPRYKDALDAARVRYEAHTYPGTQHGFNNNTTPRYDASAAQLAWQRTLDFFNSHLRA